MTHKGSPLLKRSYHIPLAMYDDAFLKFQRKYVYPQNILVTVILLAIGGVYVAAALRDTSNTLTYLLIVACVAIVLVRWYRTFKLRGAVHEALKEVESDLYELSVYEDGISIRTEDAPEAAVPAEPEQQPEEAESTEDAASDGNGFNPLFPEEPAEREPIPATEIPFGAGVKIHEYEEYFMVYLVKQNFYLIPKKDFSADEIEQMKKLFAIS